MNFLWGSNEGKEAVAAAASLREEDVEMGEDFVQVEEGKVEKEDEFVEMKGEDEVHKKEEDGEDVEMKGDDELGKKPSFFDSVCALFLSSNFLA